jgi:hypothetical protein
VRAHGEETPFESESLGDDEEEEDENEEEGEVISTARAPSPKILPLLGDLFGRQAGILANSYIAIRPQTDVSGVSS